MCTTRTQICVHVKDSVSIYRKRTNPTVGGGNTKTLHTGGKKSGLRRTMAARFLRGQQPEFHVHCIQTRKLSNVIIMFSNLIIITDTPHASSRSRMGGRFEACRQWALLNVRRTKVRLFFCILSNHEGFLFHFGNTCE